MKKKDCVVRKNDYERYSFVVPFGCLFGKKRDKYIFKELEKLHPCFSDDCCFDSKIVFKKRNFFANVLVMDKLKFSEYKYENPRAALRIEEDGKRKVVFERKKWGWFVAFLVSLFFAFCVFGVGTKNIRLRALGDAAANSVGSIANEGSSTANSVSSTANAGVVSVQNVLGGVVSSTEAFAELTRVGFVCVEFVEKIFLLDGAISSFLWECDFGFNGSGEKVLNVGNVFEKLNLMIEGVFPEELSFDKTEVLINAINYENNRPKLNVSCSEKVIPFETESVSKNDFMKSVSNMRAFLLKNSVILEEGKDSCFYRVQVSFHNCADFFSGVAEIVEREKIVISRFQINKSDFIDVQFEILKNKTVAKVPFLEEEFKEEKVFNLFRFVGENVFVFLGKDFFKDLKGKKNGSDFARISSEKKEEKKNVIKEKNYKKIGKVLNEDGSKTVYYKNELGKIVFEVED